MKRVLKMSFLIALGFIMTNQLGAQSDTSNFKNGLIFEASYIADDVNNITGGIKTGSNYLGMASLNLGFDFEKANLWKGGMFFMHGANTHGGTPTANLIGDIQTLSNIEAGEHTYIQQLWYRQSITNFEFTAGLQDLNAEFVNTEHGALYLNSSFGILPVVSINVPAPIFPLTALGFTSKCAINDKATWMAAIYDGTPTDFDHNPYNLKWQFDHGDGILAVTELQYTTNFNNLQGTVKLGGFTHTHMFENNIADSIDFTNYGFYFITDQTLWKGAGDDERIGAFIQLSSSPKTHSDVFFYAGGGINYYAPFRKRSNDVAGLAIAHAALQSSPGNETSIELTYQAQITPNLFIQPDIHYIINPAGTGAKLNNSLVATLRVGIDF